MVLDPCSGCGRRLSGAARKKIEGQRDRDGTWSFWVAWEYSCLMCGERLSGE